MEVVTIDLAEGCDVQLDVARDPFPDLGDVDVCVPERRGHDHDRARAPHDARAVAARHRREPDRRVPDRAGVPRRDAGARIRADRGDLERRGRVGLPGQVAYSASKAGLIGMVRTIAAENVARGITANAVLPGFVETEQVRAMPADVLERVTRRCPRGAWRAPPRSPRWLPTSPHRRPATSRARRSASTAACG